MWKGPEGGSRRPVPRIPGSAAAALAAASLTAASLFACRGAPDPQAACRPLDPPEVAREVRGDVAIHLDFPVPEPPFKYQFFVADLTGDGRPDFTYRSEDRVHAFDHRGEPLWSVPIANPQVDLGIAGGTAHAAADVDGDGGPEVLALDDGNRLHVLDGATGRPRRTVELPQVHPRSRWVYVAAADLRGRGDRDVLLQTLDERNEAPWRYLNRNLLAWDLEADRELWRVVQGDDPEASPWRGYWGVAHGPFRSADVDGDGRDEVVGGNMVDHDGSVVDLDYPREWVGVREDGWIGHLDALLIGKLREDVPGLQWVVTEEDHHRNEGWHTSMLSTAGVLWRHETDLFPPGMAREPQNVAAGRFDPQRPHTQVWVRSRLPKETLMDVEVSQHPWVLDASGTRVAHWRTADALPPGFNHHEEGNCRGLEIISAVDWTGNGAEHLAATARHVEGNVGVFDALTGAAVWHTPADAPPVRATLIYVADVTADGREEVVIHDAATGTVRVYRNSVEAPEGLQSRWTEPHYGRLKQNWNYYSP